MCKQCMCLRLTISCADMCQAESIVTVTSVTSVTTVTSINSVTSVTSTSGIYSVIGMISVKHVRDNRGLYTLLQVVVAALGHTCSVGSFCL